MTDQTPRIERVTLTDEEHLRIRLAQHDGLCPTGPDCLSRFPHSHATTVTATLTPSLIRGVKRIVAAREQALREEIAGQIEDNWIAPLLSGDDAHNAALRLAARIARGES